MLATAAKNAVRSAISAKGIQSGLRWFIHNRSVPAEWRELAHRKLAKRARFGPNSTFRYVCNGVPITLLHVGTANYLFWLNEYEPESSSLFIALARESSLILDIGSADGLYSLFAAASNPNARILAFEPGSAAARTIEKNLKLNAQMTRQVELRELALGEADSEAILFVAGESGGTSSLNPEFRSSRVEQPVRVRAGDGLLSELGVGRVDLIKIDTESTEPAVLRGLDATIQRDHPDILCEVLYGRTERELEAFVTRHGYRSYRVTSAGLVATERLDGDKTYREPNFLFTVRSVESLAQIGFRPLG